MFSLSASAAILLATLTLTLAQDGTKDENHSMGSDTLLFDQTQPIVRYANVGKLILGKRETGDYREIAEVVESKHGGPRVKKMYNNFPPGAYITYVNIEDKKGKNGGMVKVVSGGVQQGLLELAFESVNDHGYEYHVQIFIIQDKLFSASTKSHAS